MQNQFTVITTRKQGTEYFSFDGEILQLKLIDFWRWNTSDLLNNTMRGKLAEFIIATALGISSGYRLEWDDFDLNYNGLKIEIKSGAYLQSWEQNKYSNILFSIKPTKDFNGTDFKRQSDIYIFAVLSHQDASTINPLKLEQWDFYIIKTSELNNKLSNQKTISLKSLLKLDYVKSSYSELKQLTNSLKIAKK